MKKLVKCLDAKYDITSGDIMLHLLMVDTNEKQMAVLNKSHFSNRQNEDGQPTHDDMLKLATSFKECPNNFYLEVDHQPVDVELVDVDEKVEVAQEIMETMDRVAEL